MNDHKILLKIVSLSGTYEEDYPHHQKLSHVMKDAFKRLEITPSEGEDWGLFYEATRLNLDRTIEEAGLPSGTTLTLAPQEGGGGTQWTLR